MKTIQIKSLSLVNFKGIRKLEIKDFQKETDIFGDNGTGKTSVFDAFVWLLFGKDSTDRTNFEIKTLDKDNNEIPKLDHEVSAILTVDGEEITLRRIFREKWVKKRGSLEPEFGGNETIYEWNDVPLTLRDYTAKINDLVDEKIFKLITSPYAFNALKWNEQREVLIDISGGVTDVQVAKGNKEFEQLLTKLTNKSLDEYQKQIASSIRKSKETIKMIPTRIDEVERGKPEASDFSTLEKELNKKNKELAGVESKISDKVAAQQEILSKRSQLQKEVHALETQIEDEKHKLKLQAKTEFQKQNNQANDIQGKINAKNEELTKADKTLTRINSEIKDAEGEIKSLTDANAKIREQWNARNAEVFKMDEDSCKCPTCKREFESDDIEAKKKELFANFQQAKMKDLGELSAKGKKNKATIDELTTDVISLKGRIEKGTDLIDGIVSELEDLNQALASSQDVDELLSEEEIYNGLFNFNKVIKTDVIKIEQLRKDLEEVKGVDVSELKTEKDAITKEIEELKSGLAAKDQIQLAEKRIAALQDEESQLAQTIADYEKDQFIIERFIKAKIDRLESVINDRFKFVNFKLFETQVNGGEVPTCKALINGVPFSDANTASKINAGVDIINTLCDHYLVSAPIFIDNRESVVELIDSKSQIINLIVSKKDKKLRVEAGEMVEMF